VGGRVFGFAPGAVGAQGNVDREPERPAMGRGRGGGGSLGGDAHGHRNGSGVHPLSRVGAGEARPRGQGSPEARGPKVPRLAPRATRVQNFPSPAQLAAGGCTEPVFPQPWVTTPTWTARVHASRAGRDVDDRHVTLGEDGARTTAVRVEAPVLAAFRRDDVSLPSRPGAIPAGLHGPNGPRRRIPL